MCSIKKLFLEISQNSQEKLCARVYFLLKFQPLSLLTNFSPVSHFYTPRKRQKTKGIEGVQKCDTELKWVNSIIKWYCSYCITVIRIDTILSKNIQNNFQNLLFTKLLTQSGDQTFFEDFTRPQTHFSRPKPSGECEVTPLSSTFNVNDLMSESDSSDTFDEN